MRGLEATLKLYSEVKDEDQSVFASEALRRVYDDISPNDRPLTATLLYSVLRRETLWKSVLKKYCKRNLTTMNATTRSALMIGVAGIFELKHFALPVLVNGLVGAVKSAGVEEDVPLVNAVLHTVADDGHKLLRYLEKSSELSDLALYHGVPGWAAATWGRELSLPVAKKLVKNLGMKKYLSLRLSPNVDRDEYLKKFNEKENLPAWESPDVACSVRTASNMFPPSLLGFDKGEVMPQSESSMLVPIALAEKLKNLTDITVLDMCCGRGVKTAQLAMLLPKAKVFAWDISEGKIHSAERELKRLHVGDRVTLQCGNSLLLKMTDRPDAIMLDAPCSGSGTWARHPDSKWRLEPRDIAENAILQKKLLTRAFSLVKPGGFVLYSTCSLFRDENEEVVADCIAKTTEIVELPLRLKQKFTAPAKPYGTAIYPDLPWVDGFYMALFYKKK